MSPPLWTDPKVGAKKRIAHYLFTEVGEGGTFSFQDVRKDIAGIEQLARRMRELREAGWQILSYKDTGQLRPDELKLAKVGDHVWVDGYRWPTRRTSTVARRRVFERDGQRCMVCGIDLGTEYPDRPGVVAKPTVGHIVPKDRGGTDDLSNLRAECHLCGEASRDKQAPADIERLKRRIGELSSADRQTLAAWMLAGQRTFTEAEQFWAEFKQLPASDREQVQRALSAAL